MNGICQRAGDTFWNMTMFTHNMSICLPHVHLRIFYTPRQRSEEKDFHGQAKAKTNITDINKSTK